MFKKMKENKKKRFHTGRTYRCTGNSCNPGSSADPGTDWIY